MAKNWNPKLPKAYQPYKPPKFNDPFKMPKEPKREPEPHIMTEYERTIIRQLTPIIQNKQLIRFWYQDKTTDFEGWRLIEPHSIGQLSAKTANIILTGWFLPSPEQILRGHEEDWKNYILDEVKKIEILENKYRLTRPRYNPQDKRMTIIYCATSLRVI